MTNPTEFIYDKTYNKVEFYYCYIKYNTNAIKNYLMY